MGIDLTLYPQRHNSMSWKLCTERLSYDRCYELFAQLTDMKNRGLPAPTIKAHKLPKDWKVDVYGDEGVETVTTDPYGDPLTFCYARELKELKYPEGYGHWNAAIKAFIEQLEDETPIILWWH